MAPKLKVEIRETVTLNNNNKYDAYNRFTLEGINHVDKRTIRVNTGGTEIIALSGSGVTQVYKEEDDRVEKIYNEYKSKKEPEVVEQVIERVVEDKVEDKIGKGGVKTNI